MRTYTQIAGQFFSQPLLLRPETAEVISAFLVGRMDGDAQVSEFERPEENASRFTGTPALDGSGRYMGYRMAPGGVAIVNLMGELVNRGAWMNSSSGLTSYEGFQQVLRNAAADPNVRSIVIDGETPGGQAQGAFETAALVRKIRDEKPVTAIANGLLASAGYAIASAATRIVLPPSGMVGSIGVVMIHLDRSGQLAKAGVTPTLIYAGAHKVDGNPFSALPEETRARFQDGVDRTYSAFVQTVAAGRGSRLSEKGARQTEARMFAGKDAVDIGLADAVATFEEAIAEASARPRAQPFTTRMSMSENTPDTVARADHNAAVESARREGAAAATARIDAILNCDEAKGRPKLAAHLAFKTQNSAEDAKGLLGAAAVEAQAEAPKTGEQAFFERKEQAGLQPGALNEPPKAPAASWARHIEAANRSNGIN